MSTRGVDLLHVRLKEELDRLALKPAAAAKAAGEPDSQGLRDVLGGRKRLSAELLSALSATGVDVAYVLTGKKNLEQPPALTAEERVLLDGFRSLDAGTRKRLLAFVLSGDMPSGGAQQSFHAPVSGGVAGRNIVNKKKE